MKRARAPTQPSTHTHTHTQSHKHSHALANVNLQNASVKTALDLFQAAHIELSHTSAGPAESAVVAEAARDDAQKHALGSA